MFAVLAGVGGRAVRRVPYPVRLVQMLCEIVHRLIIVADIDAFHMVEPEMQVVSVRRGPARGRGLSEL